jgi:hypothetical protein
MQRTKSYSSSQSYSSNNGRIDYSSSQQNYSNINGEVHNDLFANKIIEYNDKKYLLEIFKHDNHNKIKLTDIQNKNNIIKTINSSKINLPNLINELNKTKIITNKKLSKSRKKHSTTSNNKKLSKSRKKHSTTSNNKKLRKSTTTIDNLAGSVSSSSESSSNQSPTTQVVKKLQNTYRTFHFPKQYNFFSLKGTVILDMIKSGIKIDDSGSYPESNKVNLSKNFDSFTKHINFDKVDKRSLLKQSEDKIIQLFIEGFMVSIFNGYLLSNVTNFPIITFKGKNDKKARRIWSTNLNFNIDDDNSITYYLVNVFLKDIDFKKLAIIYIILVYLEEKWSDVSPYINKKLGPNGPRGLKRLIINILDDIQILLTKWINLSLKWVFIDIINRHSTKNTKQTQIYYDINSINFDLAVYKAKIMSLRKYKNNKPFPSIKYYKTEYNFIVKNIDYDFTVKNL